MNRPEAKMRQHRDALIAQDSLIRPAVTVSDFGTTNASTDAACACAPRCPALHAPIGLSHVDVWFNLATFGTSNCFIVKEVLAILSE